MHVEATFYKIGAEQLHAAEAGASAERLAELTNQPADSTIVNMLMGGILYVTIKKGRDVAERNGTRHMRASLEHEWTDCGHRESLLWSINLHYHQALLR